MSSQMGHVGSERDRTVYVMTKHAIEGLTKAMAVELAPKGVRVVSIAPTFIDTPLVRPFFDDPTFRQWVLNRIPLGRLGTVEEVASRSSFSPRPPPRSSPGRACSPTAAGPHGEPVRRRDLLTLLGGGAFAWPVMVLAQQRAMPVVGYPPPARPRAAPR